MALTYYDDMLIAKLKNWIPENSHLRVLKPTESKRLFETIADDKADSQFKLPFIALSRDTGIELQSTTKSNKSYDGLKILVDEDGNLANTEKSLQLNVIPVKVEYKLDIYTKTYEEGDEYLRSLLFKLINNPVLKVDIPYNNANIQHTANIRVLSNIEDTSDITERIFSGQFTRWTISLELQDAFLFSIPYRKNWRIYLDDGSVTNLTDEEKEALSPKLISHETTKDMQNEINGEVQ